MITIDNTIISNELIEKKFVCDLKKCKGECCVEGDEGAPLEEEEISIIEDYKKTRPGRKIKFNVEKGLTAVGDRSLLQSALENLIDNAWKFTGKKKKEPASSPQQLELF